MSLTDRIQQLSTKHGHTFASIERAVELGRGTIRKWDDNIPSADKLHKVAKMLLTTSEWLLDGIETVADSTQSSASVKTKLEHLLLENFRDLNDKQQRRLINATARALPENEYDKKIQPAADLSNTPMPAPKQKNKASPAVMSVPAAAPPPDPAPYDEEPTVDMPVYELRVSAGSGNLWCDEFFETIPFKASEIPDRADFAMRISGDSMEPRILDKSLVWVKKCPWVEDGQIGVFVHDGEVYCKKFKIDPNDRDIAYLLSLNDTEYEPIKVERDDDFGVIGKVLF